MQQTKIYSKEDGTIVMEPLEQINCAQSVSQSGKKYYDKKSTPLLFHKIFIYVSIPINFVYSAYMFIFFASLFTQLEIISVLVCVYFFLTMASAVICFIGSIKWKPYGLYGIVALLILSLISGIFLGWLYSQEGMVYQYYAFNPVYFSIVYTVLVGIYYYKRRFLFLASNKNDIE